MTPLLPPGVIFHSSFSSKSRYFSLVMMSRDSPPTMVRSVPSSTFQILSGKLSCLKPRQAFVDFPSKRTFHFPFFASAGEQPIANMSSNPASFLIIRYLLQMGKRLSQSKVEWLQSILTHVPFAPCFRSEEPAVSSPVREGGEISSRKP